MSKQAQHCPGGVCEIVKKDKIQTFNKAQKFIVTLAMLAFFIGLYAYFTKVESTTFLSKKINMMMLSDKDKQALQDAKTEEAFRAFDEEDDEEYD
jgi:amino acid permease